MKRLRIQWFSSIFLACCLVFIYNPGLADDTCMFTVTADDVPPNIVILLDNGAQAKQIVWHPDYDDEVDYTPRDGINNDGDAETDEEDEIALEAAWRVEVTGIDPSLRGTGNGFFHDNGYAICAGNSLVPIPDDLASDSGDCNSSGDKKITAVSTRTDNRDADFATFTVTNSVTGVSRTIELGAMANTAKFLPNQGPAGDTGEIIDNAGYFRYSKNYLNWLFFSGLYAGDGSDLPKVSRFYYAKKAIMTVSKLTENNAKYGIFNFANDTGASSVQPLGFVVDTPLAALPEDNTLDSNYENNINNMGTVTYSPLAEGLSTIGYYFSSNASGVGDDAIMDEYCQKLFALVITPGISSMDEGTPSQHVPDSLSDYDGDNAADGIGEGIIKKDGVEYTIPKIDAAGGTTYLDDVAYYLYNNDVITSTAVRENVTIYTVGFMGEEVSNLFLINTSNNGNGNTNLYDSSDPEYGKYHFDASTPDELSSQLMAALNSILSRTSSFTAPVVPVTRTTSGNRLYMAFFKPLQGNFWQGNVTKFGISSDNEIIDADGGLATWPNGAMKEDADPYWATIDWANPDKPNHMENQTGYTNSRNIYTYLGTNPDLTAGTNSFVSTNAGLTAAMLGNPTHTTTEIINYIRGADVFDEDSDTITTENRETITGDVLHSEPLVVYYDSSTTMVYFGANDGMLHAVKDSDGTEAWAFIPTDQLPRLKDIVEGAGHQIYVDASPKAYIEDVDEDGEIEFADGDQVILVCGQRKGGTSYFALDVTRPLAPEFKWEFNQAVLAELGESWSEPKFGVVKTSDADTGTSVFFIGGGYSSDNSKGKAVYAINTLTGAVEKTFDAGMAYSFPSAVTVVDADSNGIIDKVYCGDLGGQMWRFGKFTDAGGAPLDFPECDENISNWTGQVLFNAANAKKFYYPPSVTLEKGYDAVFFGSGDREDACATGTSDRIYCVKDTHADTTLQEVNLVDVTDPAAAAPDLSDDTGDVDTNGNIDQGWYIQLAAGEKVLAEGTVFYKTFYVTTFTPNNDPCLPGGIAKLYALAHLTGGAVLDFDGNDSTERSTEIGGGIPSKPVTVITEAGQKLFMSVGSTNPDAQSEEIGAGIKSVDPLAPANNFFMSWWEEL